MSENIEKKVKELLIQQQFKLEAYREENEYLKQQNKTLIAALENLKMFEHLKK